MSATAIQSTKSNLERYTELWAVYYATHDFGGTSIEAAAAYAAMDCMNTCKGWSQAEIEDDIAYWSAKILG
jgi:hypothetical protein